MIKVIIADDQVLLRNSLKQIISIDEEIEVIEMAENGEDAINKCRILKPDIVIMDIEMPKMDGITALKIIKQKTPDIKVIILTTFDSKENILRSFLAGSDGYITKDTTPKQLIETIKCVSYGLIVIHNGVKEIMVDRFEKTSVNQNDMRNLLTEEELEIVEMIVYGKSNKQIASKFNYSEGTIKNKVSKIYEKLNVTDRIQLAVHTLKNGII